MAAANPLGSHWEGWAQLDGLLSGPLPDPAAAAALRTSLAAQPGPWPPAVLSEDGGRFHLLMGDAPFEVPPGGAAGLAQTITGQLERWLESAGLEAAACDSTVRLRVWGAGTEEQTLVVASPSGLQAMSRQVDVATLAPPAVARLSRWRRWIEGALVLVAAVLAWFFLRTPPAPDWGSVAVELGPFEGLVSFEERESGAVLVPVLDDTQLRAELAGAEPGTPRALAVEDMLRGRVHLRCLDAAGAPVGPAWIGLALEPEETRLRAALPAGCSTVRLVP